MADGPWERAGVDRETWYAVRMMAMAIRETARLPIDPTAKDEALPADHERLGEYADRLLSARPLLGPATPATGLRRARRVGPRDREARTIARDRRRLRDRLALCVDHRDRLRAEG